MEEREREGERGGEREREREREIERGRSCENEAAAVYGVAVCLDDALQKFNFRGGNAKRRRTATASFCTAASS